jgi:hypothetical protein
LTGGKCKKSRKEKIGRRERYFDGFLFGELD